MRRAVWEFESWCSLVVFLDRAEVGKDSGCMDTEGELLFDRGDTPNQLLPPYIRVLF